MIRRLGSFFTFLSLRLVPDPFVFALILTFVTFVLGMVLGGKGAAEMVRMWGRGLMGSEFLTFAAQMCLVLITGHALAATAPVRRLLKAVAGVPRSQFGAVALTTLTASVLGLINWGLGLIGGAMLCREMGAQARRRGLPVSYALLCAAAYTGLMVWHGGLSGSAPLKAAEEGHFLADRMGVLSIRQTILAPMNLVVSCALVAALPLVMGAMSPRRREEIDEMPDGIYEETVRGAAARPARATFAGRLENSALITAVFALLGAGYLILHFREKGFGGVDLNSIITAFLVAGFILHASPAAYVRAVADAVRGCGGILLQFPFYAGIMGMMHGAGLVAIISDWFVGFSTGFTYPLFTFVSASIVNVFVPSGGGQWMLQGPIMVEAAPKLGVSFSHTLMAVAYGDQVTNMIQPFWTLPLLGITHLEARQIMGYSAVACIFGFVIMGLGVTFLGFLI
ncbi:MAG: TIGR00366 family protein [bacterium]